MASSLTPIKNGGLRSFLDQAGSKLVCAVVLDKYALELAPLIPDLVRPIEQAIAKSSWCIGCFVDCRECTQEHERFDLSHKLTIIFYKNGREERRVAEGGLGETVAEAVKHIANSKDPFGGQGRTLADAAPNRGSFLDQLQQRQQQVPQPSPNQGSFLDQLQQRQQHTQQQVPQPSPNQGSFLDQLQQRQQHTQQPQQQAARPATAKVRHRDWDLVEQVVRPLLTEGQITRYVDRCQDTSFLGPDRDQYMIPHRILMAMYATATNDAQALSKWLQEFDTGARSFYKKNTAPDLREQDIDAEVERIMSGKPAPEPSKPAPKPAPKPAEKPAPKPQPSLSKTGPIHPAADTVTIAFDINGQKSRKTLPIGTTLRGAIESLKAEGAIPTGAQIQVTQFNAVVQESCYDAALKNRELFAIRF